MTRFEVGDYIVRHTQYANIDLLAEVMEATDDRIIVNKFVVERAAINFKKYVKTILDIHELEDAKTCTTGEYNDYLASMVAQEMARRTLNTIEIECGSNEEFKKRLLTLLAAEFEMQAIMKGM